MRDFWPADGERLRDRGLEALTRRMGGRLSGTASVLQFPRPNPIGGILQDGKTHVFITIHEVSEVLDGGRFVAHSPRVPLPPDGNGAIVHRMTWPRMGGWIQAQVLRLIAAPVVTMH